MLPHWRQLGCTYFVTFRLADSIPKPVVDQWSYERDKWLQARGAALRGRDWSSALKKLSPRDRQQFERIFTGKLFEYLDRGIGSCVLQKPSVTRLMSEAILHFQGTRLDVGDFVTMPNHVPALLTPYAAHELEDLLQSLKSYTSSRINRERGASGTLWMRESHDRLVRDGEELLRIQAYIRANPEKAKLHFGQYILREAEYDLKEP